MNRINRSFATVFILVAAAVLFAACQNAFVGESGAAPGSIVINIPRFSSVIQSNRNISAKAYLVADRVELELRDIGGTLVDSHTIFGSSVGSWDIPPGTDYTLSAFIYNESRVASTQHVVEGSFGPFDIGSYQTVDATITAFPNAPVALVDNTTSAMFTENTGGEQWFTAATGPDDDSLYVVINSYASSNTDVPQVDADFDLYVYGPDGLQIDYVALNSDTNIETGDSESLLVEDTVPVLPNSIYYIGVYAWRGGDFDVMFDAENTTTVLLSEGFEGGSITWNTFDSVGGVGATIWHASSVDSNTGTYSAATGGSYPNSADAELLTPNLDLTAYSSATDITLTFWEFYDTESGWDDVEIWVFSYDRASPNDWTQLLDRSGTNGVWQQNMPARRYMSISGSTQMVRSTTMVGGTSTTSK